MIRIFKDIRKGLINQSKLGKYLLYAIGEIALVMIGILLALYVNNINENNKNEQLAAIYMNDLVTDLKADIAILNKNINTNTSKIAEIDTIYQTYFKADRLSMPAKINHIVRHIPITTETYFIPERSTIHQIEASSHGALIENKLLRDQVFRYYSWHHRMEMNNEKSVQLYQHNYIVPTMIELFADGDLWQARFGTSMGLPKGENYMHLITDKKYAAALEMSKTNSRSQNQQYQQAITMAEELLRMLETELQKIEG